MSNQQNDIIFEQAQQWLTDRGHERKDVMWDEENHKHYIIDISEMDEGENGDYTKKKVYLPEQFNIAFF